MSRIKFHLNNTKAEHTTKINCVFSFAGRRYKIPSDHSIPTKYWNKSKQRVKEYVEFSEAASINNDLDVMSNAALQSIKDCTLRGLTPDLKTFKQLIAKAMNKVAHSPSEFWEYFDAFVEEKSKWVTKDVRKDYHNSLRKHLRIVEQKYVSSPKNWTV